MARRNLDDTEAEILCQKTEPEQREAPLLRLQGNSGDDRVGRNPLREETISLRLDPVVGQRFDGIPKEVANQDQE